VQRADTSKTKPDSMRVATDTSKAKGDTTVRAGRARRPRPVIDPRIKDTLAPPISAKRAFFYSALIPGLGQSRLDRGRAGALFYTTEIVSIVMAIKAADDLRFAKAHAADSVILTYKFNADGTIQRDSLGNPIGDTFARNRYGGNLVRARRTHLEDWYALIIFNHLIAGAEAFVSAQLWDFPARVKLEALPRGGAITFSIPW
jgi:hypothetical protein